MYTNPTFAYRAAQAAVALFVLVLIIGFATRSDAMTSQQPKIIGIRAERSCHEDQVLVPIEVNADRTRYQCVTLDDFADAESIARLDAILNR